MALLNTADASQFKAVEAAAGKTLYMAFMAALADREELCQDDASWPYTDGPVLDKNNAPVLDKAGVAREDTYDTYDNVVADEPAKGRKRPAAVSTRLRTFLAVPFVKTAELINAAGPIQGPDVLAWLEAAAAAGDVEDAEVVVSAVRVVRAGRALVSREQTCLARNGPAKRRLEELVNKLVADAKADPGADEVARFYLDFIKVLAWHAAADACEKRVSLNPAYLRQLLRRLQAGAPGVFSEDELEFLANSAQAADVAKAADKAERAAAKAAAAAAKAAA